MNRRSAYVALALAACGCGLAPAASADDTPGPPDQHFVLGPLFALPANDDPPEAQSESSADAIPAQELAAGLDVKIDQRRRKFRSRTVDWMTERSAAMGRMTDFLLGGADTGWHLVVDPRGADEYILEWKVRFR